MKPPSEKRRHRAPGPPNLRRRALVASALLAPCLGTIAASLARAQSVGTAAALREPPYFLVLLVQATRLDYENHATLLRSLHKSSQFKNGFLGHSWVLLSGIEGGRRQVVEVGLSPKGDGSMQFYRGVLELAQYGYVNPTEEQKAAPRHEPDPISYLWRDHENGYLQQASEFWVRPTYAARVYLNADQYHRIRAQLDPDLPLHKSFQLTGRQCSSFVAELAALAGINLKHQVTIPIPREVEVGGRRLRMWTDARYSSITLSTPDIIEQDLKRLVASGRAEDALSWYFSSAR